VSTVDIFPLPSGYTQCVPGKHLGTAGEEEEEDAWSDDEEEVVVEHHLAFRQRQEDKAWTEEASCPKE